MKESDSETWRYFK